MKKINEYLKDNENNAMRDDLRKSLKQRIKENNFIKVVNKDGSQGQVDDDVIEYAIDQLFEVAKGTNNDKKLIKGIFGISDWIVFK